ncbi:hypothetical protein AB0Y14_06890 [Rothia sp. HC945]|uniref:hypothetical protein n=1 Tax=Rothia sp. HC945 TaxID=3171170 RepID=UPI003F250030
MTHDGAVVLGLGSGPVATLQIHDPSTYCRQPDCTGTNAYCGGGRVGFLADLGIDAALRDSAHLRGVQGPHAAGRVAANGNESSSGLISCW